MSQADRFERACAALTAALSEFAAAMLDELRRIESTVAPHSHPPAPPAVTDHSAAATIDAASDGDYLDVSSKTAPAEHVAPPAASSAERKWSPERLAVLEETYSSGTPLDDIHRRLNAMPGAEVTKIGIGVQAAYRGWKRPSSAAAAPAAKPVTVHEASVPPVAAPAAAPRRPALAVAPLKLSAADYWTPQRLTTARPLYESGAPMAQIVGALNALPGPHIDAQRVNLRAGAAHWKRGVVALASPSTIPVPANATEIIHWAGERGIMVHGPQLPMEVINAKRAHLGMPPFELTPARHGAVR